MNNNVEKFEENKDLTDDELAVLNDEELWKKAAEASKSKAKFSRSSLPKS